MTELLAIGDERVWCYPADGSPIDSERRATDLVGEASYHRATLIAVPVDRLGPDFFQLRSGVAGMITQKLVNYRLRCAVIGDITAYLAASDALRDWVRESNRGRDLWFVDSLDDLAARLDATGPPQ